MNLNMNVNKLFCYRKISKIDFSTSLVDYYEIKKKVHFRGVNFKMQFNCFMLSLLHNYVYFSTGLVNIQLKIYLNGENANFDLHVFIWNYERKIPWKISLLHRFLSFSSLKQNMIMAMHSCVWLINGLLVHKEFKIKLNNENLSFVLHIFVWIQREFCGKNPF